MEVGLKIWRQLLDLDWEGWSIPFYGTEHGNCPDVCICGQVWAWDHTTLRWHCAICKGKNSKPWKVSSYDISILEKELEIHRSWIEYGIAHAIALEYNK